MTSSADDACFEVTVIVDYNRPRLRRLKMPKLATRGRLMNVVTDCKHKTQKLYSSCLDSFAPKCSVGILSRCAEKKLAGEI